MKRLWMARQGRSGFGQKTEGRRRETWEADEPLLQMGRPCSIWILKSRMEEIWRGSFPLLGYERHESVQDLTWRGERWKRQKATCLSVKSNAMKIRKLFFRYIIKRLTEKLLAECVMCSQFITWWEYCSLLG